MHTPWLCIYQFECFQDGCYAEYKKGVIKWYSDIYKKYINKFGEFIQKFVFTIALS